ncbi:MAG TPA: carotenoid oxygenase family protein [Candidatus Dormibacteraeota bacterium]|nr:carotenoid oxygenase family protein [Candidatus Dormibacteraeota bacterium]
MTEKREQDLPFHLRGNYAPVTEERTVVDLKVEGAIPPALRGVYMRNGPNPRSGYSPHWFVGDGMLHGVRLENGRARWYRNRYVRTRTFTDGVEFVDANGNVDHSAGVNNTNVVQHAGRILALVESSFPVEVTRELDTVGLCDFGGRLTTGFTAHPKPCPLTGELHFFGYRFLPPFLTYHVLDPRGALVKSEVIEVPGPTMIHDFAITQHHVVFMDLPVVFDVELAMQQRFPYRWSDDYGARLGVMPRGGSNADVRWFEIHPCYVFHPLNAYDDGATIVMDVARYPELWRGGAEGISTAMLWRWTIDLAAGRVGERQLDDRPVEFPRADDRRSGLRHRYGYAAGNVFEGDDDRTQSCALVKYDLQTDSATTHEFGLGRTPSEGVFVPTSASAGEDEGWVMQYVYDASRDASDLVIVDASDLRTVATVHLPCRVPYGFHGNWIAD